MTRVIKIKLSGFYLGMKCPVPLYCFKNILLKKVSTHFAPVNF